MGGGEGGTDPLGELSFVNMCFTIGFSDCVYVSKISIMLTITTAPTQYL